MCCDLKDGVGVGGWVGGVRWVGGRITYLKERRKRKRGWLEILTWTTNAMSLYHFLRPWVLSNPR